VQLCTNLEINFTSQLQFFLMGDPGGEVNNLGGHNNSSRKCMGALIVMAPILLCWPTMLEAHAGGMAVEVEPSHQQFVSFVAT
jgi:hypothetical protein